MADARRHNFDLNKSVQTRGIDLQKQELNRQRRTGLRDIGQSRDQGIEAAVNNALQRGIFRSGITTENKQLVNREADEAAGDLNERLRIAMAQLNNSRRGITGSMFDDGSGGSDPMAELMDVINKFLFDRDPQVAFPGAVPSPIKGPLQGGGVS